MKATSRKEQVVYPLIRIITFGEFAIERLVAASQAVRYMRVPWEEWGNRKAAMTLLKVLLCSPGRRASREMLIRAIWPDHQKINAAHALDSAAYVLRKHILGTQAKEGLLSTPHDDGMSGLQLSAQSRLWVDADAFLSLASQAVRLEAQGQDPLPYLERAHTLAQGTFLENDQHQPWSNARRITIDGARHRVLYKLVEYYLQHQRENRAEEVLFDFLEEHPTDEDALYHLLRLLSHQERHQEALNIYEYVIDILREERQEPTPQVQELVRHIQQGLAVRESHMDYMLPASSDSPATMQSTQTQKAYPRKEKTTPSQEKVQVLHIMIERHTL